MRSIQSNLIACGLTAALLLGIAACSKRESAAETANAVSTAEMAGAADGGAMPASAPMPQEAAKAVSESARGLSAAAALDGFGCLADDCGGVVALFDEVVGHGHGQERFA